MQPFWKGPVEVVRQTGPVDYMMKFPDKTFRVLHAQHLSPSNSADGSLTVKPLINEFGGQEDDSESELSSRQDSETEDSSDEDS